ncbi:glutaredoxin domain-containing protein [uncultured Peptoniphilus sp.]|uniref:glutaredoxin family protein n=1 Tax=uncultured Peptoniphilus sp. TaxID=254354 RepID=UPI002805B354|nr:glutaredoxin domain-containing protein [uncultured Peptoniphilus sp.]
MKKFIFIFVFMLLMPVFGQEAKEVKEKIYLNGEEQNIISYEINGENYLRLRDLAFTLKDSNAKFSIDFDEKEGKIIVKTGKDYDGGALEAPKENLDAKENKMPILVDNRATDIKSYKINGYSYYKLKDLGEALYFDVIERDGEKTFEIVPKVYDGKALKEKYLNSDKIVVFGRDTCPDCAELKEYLKENNIDYIYKSTDDKEDRKECLAIGFETVPQTFIKGKIVSGFDAEELDKLIK